MNNNNRPNQYDWFKGKNSADGRPNKNGLKTTWRITRIFLYLALFVFTMTGCVQIFVIKTNNQIGNGVEFYTGEKQISPHVTKFNVSHSTTKSSKDVYSIAIDPKKPVWVNDSNNLLEIKSELKNQGVAKLSDAFKGINETISIQGNGVVQDAGWNKKHSIEYFGKFPVVWSSESKSSPTKLKGNNSIDNLGNRYFVIDGKTYKVDFSLFDPNKSTNLSKEEKISILAINAFLEKKLYSKSTQGNLYNYLDTHLLKSAVVPTTPPSIIKIDEQRDSAQGMVINILKYAGVKISLPQINNLGTALANVSFSKGYIPGKGTADTVYRPMVTWGDAWKRGPFYGIFVYPIGQMATHMISGMGEISGWEMILTIFLVVWIIRAITFMLSFKSVLQQTKMQEMQGKKAVIDAKYAAYKGNKQMEMRKNQEVQELYKKEGISMFGSIGSMFLTMPFFLAIWRVIGAVPHIKASEWLGISFSATSYKELFAGQFQYLPLLIFAAVFAAGQQLVPRLLTKRRNKTRINVQQKAAMKKNNRTQNIMMIVFVVMAVIFNAGLQIYWVAGGIWMIGQSIGTHHFLIWQSKRKRRLKVRA